MKRRLFHIMALALGGTVICANDAAAGTFEIVHSIDFPERTWAGYDLAWDGHYLWTSMASEWGPEYSRTYRLDPADGSVAASFPYGGDLNRGGIAYDGTCLWITSFLSGIDNALPGSPPDEWPDHLYRFALDGTLIGTFSPPHGADSINCGAAWDGSFLWLSDTKHRELTQIDTADMSIVRCFASPGSRPLGLTWDGNSLWCIDGSEKLVYQIDTEGHVLSRWASPGTDPYGIAFDGEYFWLLDNDAKKVLQVAVPEPCAGLLLGVALVSIVVVESWRRNRTTR